MRSHLLVFLVISTLGLLSNRTASANDKPDRGADETIAMQLASSYVEQQQIVRRNAPVHSAVQLAAFLAKTTSTESPINALSPAAKARFVNSLRFNETGVTSFYYADIESELSSSQAYELLSIFGLQSTLSVMPKLRASTQEDKQIMSAFGRETASMIMADHENYWCSGRATCSRDVGSICMSGC